MRLSRCLVIAGLTLGGVGLLPGPPVAHSGQFAATTEIVEVYATVTDAKGEPVTGLTAESFTVLEDGEPQAISAFASGEVPLTLAIAVDRSFSMGGTRLDAARAAATRVIDQLRAADRFLVLAIGSTVDTLVPLGTAREAARTAVGRLEPWGTSPIGDSVAAALDAVDKERGRRALVLLTDGLERYADKDRAFVLARLRAADVLVYPIALARQGSALLNELAALSGGRVFQAPDRSAAERAASGVAAELRRQYFLGYSPATRHKPAGWRRIEVRVTAPGLRVRARQGYMAE